MLFDFCLDSSRLIEYHFFKQIGIRSDVHHSFCLSLRFLFSIPYHAKSFCLFLGQKFKSFLTHPKVRHFYSFFLIKLHAFMHLFQNFHIKGNFWFLMILCILIKIVSWVFVHASHKHDSQALISKFYDFFKFSKLGFMCS